MVSIDNRFWQIADESLVQQRMRSKDWAEILLSSKDKIIVRGRLRTLVAKKMGYGIVEITLQPLTKQEGGEV